MALIFSIILVLILGFFDSSMASCVAGFFILAITILYSRVGDKEAFSERLNLALSVFCVYMVCAYIFSRSFENGNFYIVSDAMRYLDFYGDRTHFYFDKSYFIDCYYGLSDSNVLFNATLLEWCIIGNTILGGATVYYITLLQTMFGILSIITVFRILNQYFPSKECFKYALVFACCSLYLFYSCVVIRDVVIAFFYIVAIEIILKPFKFRNLLLLFVFMIVVWGLRLYSGFFYGIFIALYLYVYAQNTRYKSIAMFFFVAIACVTVVFLLGSDAMEQTVEEIEGYEELTTGHEDAKGGLIGTLYKLPPGAKQFSIMLYTQMSPFPSFTVLKQSVENFSQAMMVVDILVYEFFWFFVFYILAYSIVKNGVLSYFSTTEKLLFVVALVFLLANTSHPDIRRMMPVYPITYLLFLKTKHLILAPSVYVKNRDTMAIAYFSLTIVYLMIKGI